MCVCVGGCVCVCVCVVMGVCVCLFVCLFVFFTLNWLTPTPKTHFVQFLVKVPYFLSWGEKKGCINMNEAVMKTYKKIKIGVPEIGTFMLGVVGVVMRKIWL